MALDARHIAAGLLQAVPFAATLGLEFVDVTVGEDGPVAVVRLPDAAAHQNHVGGPHAGALFTLGETASGAVVFGAFGHRLDRVVPLTVRADIAYRKLAMGVATATARLTGPAAEIEATLDAGTRPEFPVQVAITREDGEVAAEMTVVWTLRLR
jgi:acyl-coenzyme A thioesterase PaaI-like protein